MAKGLGQFSKYATSTATPETNGRTISFSNPLGDVPKLVLIEATVTGEFLDFLVLTPAIGASSYPGKSVRNYDYLQSATDTTFAYTLTANAITATRASASMLLDATATYTAHIYA